MNHRQEMAQKTKTEIVAAGLRLFEQRGVDAVTVADIMREAGVTRTSFYAHFKSKDDIIGLVIADLDGKYVTFFENTLFSEGNRERSPLVKLELLLKERNRIIASPGAELVRYYYIRMLRSPRQPITRRYYDELVRSLIADCREEGLLGELYSDGDIFRAALALNRGVCIEWALRGGDVPIESWDVLLHNFCVSISAATGQNDRASDALA